jgi:hypothetical protein
MRSYCAFVYVATWLCCEGEIVGQNSSSSPHSQLPLMTAPPHPPPQSPDHLLLAHAAQITNPQRPFPLTRSRSLRQHHPEHPQFQFQFTLTPAPRIQSHHARRLPATTTVPPSESRPPNNLHLDLQSPPEKRPLQSHPARSPQRRIKPTVSSSCRAAHSRAARESASGAPHCTAQHARPPIPNVGDGATPGRGWDGGSVHTQYGWDVDVRRA